MSNPERPAASRPPFGYIDAGASRSQGFYGWAKARERIPARWRLARASGHGWLSAAVATARGERRVR